jgi:hypothetical protein
MYFSIFIQLVGLALFLGVGTIAFVPGVYLGCESGAVRGYVSAQGEREGKSYHKDGLTDTERRGLKGGHWGKWVYWNLRGVRMRRKGGGLPRVHTHAHV